MSICAQCAAIGKTCCQKCEILLTDGDIKRINAATGMTDFHEFRKPDNPAYLDQEDDPAWLHLAFEPDGTRRVLKRKANLDCQFLTKNGCRLDMETRPIVCRLYPYEYTEQGISGVCGSECPTHAMKLDKSLVDALSMNENDANRWRNMLYSELRACKR